MKKKTKIYYRLHSEDLKEYFGDDYSLEEEEFITRSTRKALKNFSHEYYYHQDIKEEDVFLLSPKFSQVCLVKLLAKGNVIPTYITIYKDEKPSDPFFERIGHVCPANDVFGLFQEMQEIQELQQAYAEPLKFIENTLKSDTFTGNFLQNQDQKKTLIPIDVGLASSYPSINNIKYSLVHRNFMTGTFRGLVSKNEDYDDSFLMVYFESKRLGETKERKFYVAFTSDKAYFFESSKKKEQSEEIKIIDRYLLALLESQRKRLLLDKKDKNTSKEYDDAMNTLNIAEAGMEKSELFQITLSANESFFIKITENKESFFPIPISDEKVYKDFYFFIEAALQKRALKKGRSEPWDTEISIGIDEYEIPSEDDRVKRNEKFEKYNEEQKHLYQTYAIYFLALYTRDINTKVEIKFLNKKIEELKDENDENLEADINELQSKKNQELQRINNLDTLISTIIYHLAYNRDNLDTEYQKRKKSSQMISEFLYQRKRFHDPDTQAKLENDEEVGKMKKLFEYFLDHSSVKDYFSDDETIKDKIIKQIELIRSNIVLIDVEAGFNDKVRGKQKKIINQFLKSDDNCISDELKNKAKQEYKDHIRGKTKFDFFAEYLAPNGESTIYHQLSEECKKQVDEYFSLYKAYVFSYENDEDIFHLIHTKKEVDLTLGNDIDRLENATSQLFEMEAKVFSKLKFDDIEQGINFPMLKLVFRFLDSYNKLPTDFSEKDLNREAYIQVLFYYIIERFGTASGKGDVQLQNDLNRIKYELMILSKRMYAEHLIDGVYYEWIENFFLNVTSHNILGWISSDKETLDGVWSELRKMIVIPNYEKQQQRYYEICEKNLPANPKDRRLDQNKSKVHMSIYAQTIVNIYDTRLDKNATLQVFSALNELQKKVKEEDLRQKAADKNEEVDEKALRNKLKDIKHMVFQNFLSKKSDINSVLAYLDTVVIEPNKEDYLKKKI